MLSIGPYHQIVSVKDHVSSVIHHRSYISSKLSRDRLSFDLHTLVSHLKSRLKSCRTIPRSFSRRQRMLRKSLRLPKLGPPFPLLPLIRPRYPHSIPLLQRPSQRNRSPCGNARNSRRRPSPLGGCDGTNPSGVWGAGGGDVRNTESISMPTLVGDRQSIFTDVARNERRKNQWESLVERFLGSNPASRRRNDSAQSQMVGSSLLNNVVSAVTAEGSPSLELPPVKPKIEDPLRGFTPDRPQLGCRRLECSQCESQF